MPAVNAKKLVLESLNRQNNQTFTANDITIQYSKDVGTSAVANMAGRTGGALVGAGQTTVQYRRLDVAALFALANISVFDVRRITQLSLLLPTIGRLTGINFAVSDVVEKAIVYDTNNRATVTLQPTPNNLGYQGSVVLSLRAAAQDIQLSDVITVLDYMVIDKDSDDYVKQLISANATQPLDWSGITLGRPQTNTDTAASPRNSKATLTAVNGTGYAGSVTIYFDRETYVLPDVPNLYYWPQSVDWTGTPWQWLTQFHPTIAANYKEADFTGASFTIPAYKTTFNIVVGGLSTSWTTLGSVSVPINPNYPGWNGADSIMAFDASQFAVSGFNDLMGIALLPQATAFAAPGKPMTKGVVDGPFAGGIAATGASAIMTKTAGAIPKTAYTNPWTIDFWVYHSVDAVINNAIPVTPFNAAATLAMTSYTDRLVTFHNGSSNGTYNGKWVLSNNAQNPRLTGLNNFDLGRKGWQHIAITYDGVGSTKYYCNGKLIFTLASWKISSGGDWYFGVAFQTPTQANMTSGLERWRFRSGVKFTADFDVQDLYPQYFTTKTALTSVVTQRSMGTLATNSTDNNFIDQLGTVNGKHLYADELVFSNPVPYTGSEGNTKVTLTATAAGRYSGSVDVYFTRVMFSTGTLPTKLYKFPDSVDFSGTVYQYLQKYFPTVLSTYYSNRSASDFDNTTTITVAAGQLPALTVVVQGNRWLYLPDIGIVINPTLPAWEGADLVMAWDSNVYVQGGFTDKAGNTLRGYNQYAGTAGAYPAKANLPFVFGGGLSLVGSMISTVGALPATTYSQPFTIDMWLYYATVPVAASQLPLNPLYATTNTSAFDASVRLQIGGHDSTVSGMAVWNNAATARLITASNNEYRKAGWQHVAITYDGSVFRYYSNGVLVTTSATYAVVGGAWQLAMFGVAVNGVSGVIERYRYRKGVKLQAGYTVKDLYPES